MRQQIKILTKDKANRNEIELSKIEISRVFDLYLNCICLFGTGEEAVDFGMLFVKLMKHENNENY